MGKCIPEMSHVVLWEVPVLLEHPHICGFTEWLYFFPPMDTYFLPAAPPPRLPATNKREGSKKDNKHRKKKKEVNSHRRRGKGNLKSGEASWKTGNELHMKSQTEGHKLCLIWVILDCFLRWEPQLRYLKEPPSIGGSSGSLCLASYLQTESYSESQSWCSSQT